MGREGLSVVARSEEPRRMKWPGRARDEMGVGERSILGELRRPPWNTPSPQMHSFHHPR